MTSEALSRGVCVCPFAYLADELQRHPLSLCSALCHHLDVWASSARRQGVLYNVSKGLEFHLEHVNLPPGSVTRPLCYTTVHCPLRYCPYQ